MASDLELMRKWIEEKRAWYHSDDYPNGANASFLRALAALEHVANTTDELALSNDLAAYVLRPALNILIGEKEQDNAQMPRM